MQSVHRAHFLDELVKGVPAQRAHFNKRLHTLEETETGVTLHFKDGTNATADVVIGADGVHSTVREYLMGADAAKPIFTGTVIYRGLVPMDRANEVLGPEHAQNVTILCGPGKVISQRSGRMLIGKNTGNLALSYPIDSGKTLNAAAFEFGLKEWPHIDWIIPANYEDLAEVFKCWGKPAQGLIKVYCPYPMVDPAPTHYLS